MDPQLEAIKQQRLAQLHQQYGGKVPETQEELQESQAKQRRVACD
jgi:DNA-binding TFAR19-related protein (PDSD5 family)